jgi:hypothetical protein
VIICIVLIDFSSALFTIQVFISPGFLPVILIPDLFQRKVYGNTTTATIKNAR